MAPAWNLGRERRCSRKQTLLAFLRLCLAVAVLSGRLSVTVARVTARGRGGGSSGGGSSSHSTRVDTAAALLQLKAAVRGWDALVEKYNLNITGWTDAALNHIASPECLAAPTSAATGKLPHGPTWHQGGGSSKAGSVLMWDACSPCSWTFTSCDNAGRLDRLYLTRGNLFAVSKCTAAAVESGDCQLALGAPLDTLTPGLLALPDLAELSLIGLGLTGSLPADWAAPDGLLRRLVFLDVSSNELTGTLPAEWVAGPDATEGPTTTTMAAAAGQQEAGAMPPSCWPMDFLRLRSNRLTGTLPPALRASFCGLRVLDLSYNQLQGSLPVEWLWALETSCVTDTSFNLALSGNPLGSRLPDAPATPASNPHRRAMPGSDGSVTGARHHTLSNPRHLARCSGRDGGPLPLGQQADRGAGLVKLYKHSRSTLSALQLSECGLLGTLPASWARSADLDLLGLLDLSSNRLTGPVPRSWLHKRFAPGVLAEDFHGLDGFLFDLRLWNNRLEGELPSELMVRDSGGGLVVLPGNPGLCMECISARRRQQLVMWQLQGQRNNPMEPVGTQDTTRPVMAWSCLPGSVSSSELTGLRESPDFRGARDTYWEWLPAANSNCSFVASGLPSCCGRFASLRYQPYLVAGAAVAAAALAAAIALLAGCSRPLVGTAAGSPGCGWLAAWRASRRGKQGDARRHQHASELQLFVEAEDGQQGDVQLGVRAGAGRGIAATCRPRRHRALLPSWLVETAAAVPESSTDDQGNRSIDSSSMLASGSSHAASHLPPGLPGSGASTDTSCAGSSLASKTGSASFSDQLPMPTPPPSGAWWLQSTSLRLQAVDIELCRDEGGELVLLGKGASARVYAGRLFGTLPVAVKAVCLAGTSSDEQPYSGVLAETAYQQLWREASVLRRCRHPNIVQLLGVYSGSGQAASGIGDMDGSSGPAKGFDEVGWHSSLAALWQEDEDQPPVRPEERQLLVVVMELLLGGSLEQRLGEPDMRWYQRGGQVALDVARALAFLHEGLGVAHFDVKSGNVLLSSVDGSAKLADAGLARLTRDHSTHPGAGTQLYAAPEILLCQKAGPPADVFSLGWLLQEIVVGRQLKWRGARVSLRCPDQCPARIAMLIQDCFNAEPAQRPTAKEAVRQIELSLGRGNQ